MHPAKNRPGRRPVIFYDEYMIIKQRVSYAASTGFTYSDSTSADSLLFPNFGAIKKYRQRRRSSSQKNFDVIQFTKFAGLLISKQTVSNDYVKNTAAVALKIQKIG